MRIDTTTTKKESDNPSIKVRWKEDKKEGFNTLELALLKAGKIIK